MVNSVECRESKVIVLFRIKCHGADCDQRRTIFWGRSNHDSTLIKELVDIGIRKRFLIDSLMEEGGAI